MTLQCCMCGSSAWMAASPGTSSVASRFVSDQLHEIRPTVAEPTRAWCLEHWRQSWTPVPDRSIEDEDQAIGQTDLFVQARIAKARAELAAEIAAAKNETDEAPPYRGEVR